MSMRRAALLSILFIACIVARTSARVWYVLPDGTGQAPHIQAGIDSCAAGDTVVAMPGIFTGEGNWDIDFKGKPIVVVAARIFDPVITDKTIIDGQDTETPRSFYFHSNEDSTSVLSGFVIQNFWGGKISCDHTSPTISDNEIRLCQNGGIESYHSSPRIIGNIISVYNGYSAPFYCDGGSPYIAHNAIGSDCPWEFCTGLFCSNCTSLQMLGNSVEIVGIRGCSGIIDSNDIRGCGAVLDIQSSTLIITNNKIYGGAAAVVHCWQSAVTIAGNRISGGEDRYGVGIVMYGSLPSLVVNNDIAGAEGTGACGIDYSGDSTSIIENNTIHDTQGWGIKCHSSVRIAGNLIFSSGGYGGGIYCEASPIIEGNTIVGNWGDGIYCAPGSSSIIRNNIIANHTGYYGRGIYAESPSIVVSCCNVYNNEGGNYVGIPDQTGLNGNISQDPLFCDSQHKNFSLHASSPCLPGNHPDGADCGLIGARGIGCDYVSTLLQSWFAAYAGGGITMTWTLTEERPLTSFSIWREELLEGHGELIENPQLSREGLAFAFRDADVLPGTKIRYRVELSDENGTETLFETEAIAVPAMPLSLEQNFPNPFNPQTYIRYYVPSAGRVSIEVYDAAGREVARVFDKVQERGYHVATWDGRDGNGVSVNSGVYFYRLTAGKETISKKMVLLR